MAKPFDITLKFLLDNFPGDWLRLAGIACEGPVEVVDSHVQHPGFEADRVLRIAQPEPALVHLEFQSSYATDLPDRILLYNSLLHHRDALPVWSVAVLLRPQADGRLMTGTVERECLGHRYLQFHYGLVRVWTLPAEALLSGGLGLLPLAPLAADADDRLPQIIRTIDQRLGQETSGERASSLWTTVSVLLGLKYPKDFASQLLQGVRSMKESTTYQAIVEEGRQIGQAEGRQIGQAEALRELLFDWGHERFGPPEKGLRTAIESLQDVRRLRALIEQLPKATGWDDLLSR